MADLIGVALSIAAMAGVLYLGSGWLQGIGNWNLVIFFALLLGTEGDGLSSHWLAQADVVVRIPMSRGVDSLNVAAAAAVACYELGPAESIPNRASIAGETG